MNTADATLENLLEAIRSELAEPTIEWSEPPEPLTGGFWAQMWRIRLTNAPRELDGRLVARVMPNAEVAARETAVQAHLADSGYPTPKVRLWAGPGPELDRAWMLMDFAVGEPLLPDLSGLSAVARLPRFARTLPDRLAQHMADLHAIDAAPLKSDDDDATVFVRRLGEQNAAINRPDLVATAGWLQRNRPPGGRSVICHGDLHPFNVLTEAGGDTVLDWSSTRVTDPAYDVAFTKLLLSNPPLSAPRRLVPAISAAGRALGRRFTTTYNKTAAAPVDPDQLRWFTSLHTLRILTEVATWRSQGELDDHPGHPFLSLEHPLGQRLREETGVSVDPA